MKKIIYSLMAVAAVFAMGSCNPVNEETPTPEDNTPVFEVDDLEALPAEAGTFTLGVTTNIEFTVEIPEEITWLRYVETKSAAPEVVSSLKKEVTFAIDLNEEDEMRQARIKFLDGKGEQLKALTIIQKAGAGIDFEVATPEDVPVNGATITLSVTSNVPYEVRPQVDWITVGNVTSTTAELVITSNGTVGSRDGKVNFVRKGTEKLIGDVTIHQMEPNIILTTPDKSYGFDDIAVANLMYLSLESGPAEIVLARGTHKGDFVAHSAGVPLTLTGNGVATLDGTIEIDGAAVTIKDLTIAPSEEGSLPVFDTDLKNQHGIFVHRAGYGVSIENVIIDMGKLDSDATGIFLLSEGDKGTQTDVVKNCVVDGGQAGHRLMQVYGAKANITGNTFENPFEKYAVRIGNKGGEVLLASNTFEGTAASAVHFNNLTESTITLGNGTRDTNVFEDFTGEQYKANTDVTAPSNANKFTPEVYYVTATGVVTLDIPENAGIYLNRVWGKYNGTTGEWDDEFVPNSSNNNWNRNGIISGDYVYVPICGGSSDKYGVAVFDLMTGEYLTTIKTGFKQEGTFWTSGITKLATNGGSDMIYVCNMAMSAEGNPAQDLVIYRLVEPDAEDMPTRAQEVCRYTVPEGERYGDKMSSYGTDEDGLIMFVSFYNYINLHQYRQQIEFRLTAGVLGTTVDNKADALDSNPKKGDGASNALTSGIYILYAHSTGESSTRQAIFGSNMEMRFDVGWWWNAPLNQWFNVPIDPSLPEGERTYSLLTGVGYYDDCCLDPGLFFADGVRYLAYTVVKQVDVGESNPYSSGYVRVVRIPDAAGTSDYPMLNYLWAVREDASAFQKYPIGDPDDFDAVGNEATNKTGYCDIAYRGNDVYILSGITSTGMSLFKVMK